MEPGSDRLQSASATFFFFFGVFRATPAAYGSSQSRCQIGAVAPAYATATATWDPSHVFDLHHRSWQHRILNPLSKARDRTHIFMDISWVLNPLSHNRTPYGACLFSSSFDVWMITSYEPHKPWVTFASFTTNSLAPGVIPGPAQAVQNIFIDHVPESRNFQQTKFSTVH